MPKKIRCIECNEFMDKGEHVRYKECFENHLGLTTKRKWMIVYSCKNRHTRILPTN